MTRDWSKYILPVGGLLLAYYVLRNWGVIGSSCDPTCTHCPRGDAYSQWFGQCDSNYSPCGWLHENCCCNCCMSLDGNIDNDNNSLEDMGWIPIPKYELLYLRELVDSL
jgi:hypothetical protein